MLPLTRLAVLLFRPLYLTTHKAGFDPGGLLLDVAKLVGLVLVVVLGLERSGQWLSKRLGTTNDARSTPMLAVVAICAALVELIQLEGILGAFLAGLAINSAVRDVLAREKQMFMGNAFFIPASFIATGFLIGRRVFAAGAGNLACRHYVTE